jgi:hypothetical protein
VRRRIDIHGRFPGENENVDFPSATIVHTGSSLIAGFDNDGGESNLDALRAPGITDPVAAVTYRVGCAAQ